MKSIYFYILCTILSLTNGNCIKTEETDFTERINNISQIVEPGDIILRQGDSFLSEMILFESPESNRLTHVGIVSHDKSVIDIVGDSLNPFVRKKSLSHFIKNAMPGSIYITRARSSQSNRFKISEEAESLFKKKISFDYDFISSDSKELYCSELVWISVREAIPSLQGPSLVNYRNKEIIGLQTFLNPKSFSIVYSEHNCQWHDKKNYSCL